MSKVLDFDSFWRIAIEKAAQGNHLAFHPCCDVWTHRNSKIARQSHLKTMRWKEILTSVGRIEGDMKLALLQKMKELEWRIPVIINQQCSAETSRLSGPVPAKTDQKKANKIKNGTARRISEHSPLERSKLESQDALEAKHGCVQGEISPGKMIVQVFQIADWVPGESMVHLRSVIPPCQVADRTKNTLQSCMTSGLIHQERLQGYTMNMLNSVPSEPDSTLRNYFSLLQKKPEPFTDTSNLLRRVGFLSDGHLPSIFNQALESKIDNLNREIGRLECELHRCEQENRLLKRENKSLQLENAFLLSKIDLLQVQTQEVKFDSSEQNDTTPDSSKHLSTIRSAMSSILGPSKDPGPKCFRNFKTSSLDA